MAKRTRSKKQPTFSLVLLIIFGILCIGALGVILMSMLNAKSPALSSDVAVYVNGEPITIQELDYSYDYALPEEYKTEFTKWEFLNESIIAQKLLLQQALAENVSVSPQDVQAALNEVLMYSGTTREQFELELKQLGLSWQDVELTYATRLTIAKFLNHTVLSSIEVDPAEIRQAYTDADFEEEDITMEEAYNFLEQEILAQKQSLAIQHYVDELRKNATIVILLDQAQQSITSFSFAQDQLCVENNSIPIYMFSSSTCKECRIVASRLAALLKSYEEDGSPFIPYLWELDSGDNLYTQEIESGVPSAHVLVFKKLSPQGKIPAYSFGCAYTRLGHLPSGAGNLNSEEREFDAVLSALVVQHE